MATPVGKGLLLDTNIVVRHFRDASSVVDRLSGYDELYLPYAALAELYAGAYRSARPEKNLEQIVRFLEAVDVITPDDSTPEIYGQISAQLAKTGTPIPQNDIWIAAIARQSDLPLATSDRHFEKVEGLTALIW
jgi:tRNA(fMet)-specific endonuclease VapC